MVSYCLSCVTHVYCRQMSSEKAIKTATTSPGFGITLVAETEKGSFFTAESCSHPRGSSEEPSIPEDLGKVAACELLDEINRVWILYFCEIEHYYCVFLTEVIREHIADCSCMNVISLYVSICKKRHSKIW